MKLNYLIMVSYSTFFIYKDCFTETVFGKVFEYSRHPVSSTAFFRQCKSLCNVYCVDFLFDFF